MRRSTLTTQLGELIPTGSRRTAVETAAQLLPVALRRPPGVPRRRIGAVRAAQRLNRASGLLALSVLADSGLEHYRGQFKNPAMYTPLAVSSLALLASLHGTADRRRGAHRVRDGIYALSAVTSLVGFGFHLYNVGKRPGGYRTIGNFFYGAPIGAPWALSLAGLFGFASERVRDNPPGTRVTIFGLPAGRFLTLLSSGGLMGTVGEVGLLHFRGAFQNPAMYVPVTLPPVTAGALAGAAVAPSTRPLSRLLLRLTALMGFVGVAFHAYGAGRMMGSWRNWKQNVMDGPPLPAPPSFTGVALAGLAALRLLEDHDDG